MLINNLASPSNLKLAWRRITTGGNQQYKRLFRELYYAYEIALDDNLDDLHRRLLGRTYKPKPPERIYLPKNSGLHRPLSLMFLEDQIVLQAFANLAAKRLQKKREQLQFKLIFSNILQSDDSIFFFKRWQETYAVFKRQIEKHYTAGFRWVADFDLAAFYDTISHELLIKTIYPRKQINDDMRWFLKCLGVWSSGKVSSSHGHGLPQGPIASDFLAECFLLPIDMSLRESAGYTRYVDDVRLYGPSEDNVRAAVIKLERHCRERGLIPQAGKYSIKKALSLKEALGALPSIADPHRPEGPKRLTRARAHRLLLSALGGRPRRVTDKTRLRYVMFRAEPNNRFLGLALRLLPHHPEHADVFFSYLGRFDFRRPAYKLCLELLERNPYPYVRGEAWHLLARYLRVPRAITFGAHQKLISKAIAIARDNRSEYFMEKWGACHFLAVSEEIEGRRYSRFLKFQSPLLHAFLAHALPVAAFKRGEAGVQYLHRSAFEPGLAICGRIHGLGLSLTDFGLEERDLLSQVRNTLFQLGVLQNRGSKVDPIAEVLQSRYGVTPQKSWHRLLGAEYVHALGLLMQAEATFNSGASFWLACQNSFNHAIFLALQSHLNSVGHSASIRTRNRIGELIDFGVMLDPGNGFSRTCTTVSDCFRNMNTRRNHLPVSHPYEKKTWLRCSYLKAQERNRFVNLLRKTYPDFVTLMP